MNKYHLENLKELHSKHKITHKVLILIFFSIVVVLSVYGLSRVRATQDLYLKVPNASPGVCYKVGQNFNNPVNHVSCETYEKICATSKGILVGCSTGKMIN